MLAFITEIDIIKTIPTVQKWDTPLVPGRYAIKVSVNSDRTLKSLVKKKKKKTRKFSKCC